MGTLQLKRSCLPDASARVDREVIANVRPAIIQMTLANELQPTQRIGIRTAGNRHDRVMMHGDPVDTRHRVREPTLGARTGPLGPWDHKRRNRRERIVRADAVRGRRTSLDRAGGRRVDDRVLRDRIAERAALGLNSFLRTGTAADKRAGDAQSKACLRHGRKRRASGNARRLVRQVRIRLRSWLCHTKSFGISPCFGAILPREAINLAEDQCQTEGDFAIHLGNLARFALYTGTDTRKQRICFAFRINKG